MYRVVIPTRDSAGHIGILLEAYRALGIEPIYVLDTRSTDDTAAILARMGATVKPFTPGGDFVEAGMIEFAARAAGTEWVLRLDDDEFPSARLVEWIAGTALQAMRTGFFLSRRDLFLRDGEVRYNRRRSSYTHPARPDFLGGHSRLFRPRELRFYVGLHTAGIHDETGFGFAPQDAFFVHFDGVIRSPAQRLAKIRRYEAIERGSTWRLADEYLPELFDDAHLTPGSDGLEEFAPLVQRLRRPPGDEAIALDAAEIDHAKAEVRRWTAQVATHQQMVLPDYYDDVIRVMRHAPRTLRILCGYLLSLVGRLSGRPPLRLLGVTLRRYRHRTFTTP